MNAIRCPGCQRPLFLGNLLPGKQSECPSCGRLFVVPGAASTCAVFRADTLIPLSKVSEEKTHTSVQHDPNTGPKPRLEEADGVLDLSSVLLPPLQPGDLGRLGSYRVLKVLGVGGMGIVLLGEDTQLGRPTALKVMKPALAASPSARQRFLREARSMASLEHDHIVAIYHVGDDHPLPYFAMPLLRGELLQTRLEREGKLPPEEVVRIGREMAQGLQAAHAQGVVHRDVKPSNVWLEADSGRVKILDFGLARALHEEQQVSLPGVVCGTLSYMSPEQARGEPADLRSDLFSLGCVLYRMSTGRVPFQGANVMSLVLALETQVPPPPAELCPEVPPELSDLIVRLLARARHERPESMQVVVDRLREAEETLRAHRKPEPPPAGPTREMERTVSGGRRTVLLAGAGLALLLGVAFIIWRMTPAAPPVPQRPALRMLVPAYFYPGGPGLKEWEKLFEAAADVDIAAIVNPASGPGEKADPNYGKIIDRGRAAGVAMLGYVDTRYGQRPLDQVKADVNHWVEWYPGIHGFFLDAQASAADQVAYYKAVSGHARERLPRAQVIGNPGTICSEEYLVRKAVDAVCILEGNKAPPEELPGWVRRGKPGQFAAMLYRVPDRKRMRQEIEELRERGFGRVYITDQDLPNPWERLPAWWADEVAAVREANRTAP